MQLVDALFSIARNITDSDLDDVNKLHQKAQNEVKLYASDQPGFKGLYARVHKGWIFQLVLIFLVPFATTWLLSYKNKIMSQGIEAGEASDFEDEEEQQLYDELRKKYE